MTSSIDGGGPTSAELGVTPPGAETPRPGATKISPDILSSLGLSDSDLKEFDKKEVERREKMLKAERNGASLYLRELKDRGDLQHALPEMSIQTEFDFLVVPRPATLDMIPDAILEQRERQKTDPKFIREDGHYEHDMPFIKKLLEGFGNEALKQDDWKSALNVFDIAMDGNVMGNNKLIERLRSIAMDNKPVGVEIAKTMQEKIDKRAQTPQNPTA